MSAKKKLRGKIFTEVKKKNFFFKKFFPKEDLTRVLKKVLVCQKKLTKLSKKINQKIYQRIKKI